MYIVVLLIVLWLCIVRVIRTYLDAGYQLYFQVAEEGILNDPI